MRRDCRSVREVLAIPMQHSRSSLVLLPQTMLIQPAALTVRGVYRSLRSMAEQKGPGATARRKQTILHLLRSCRFALDASQQPTQSRLHMRLWSWRLIQLSSPDKPVLPLRI